MYMYKNRKNTILTQPLYNTIAGSKAVMLLAKHCYIQTKMYRLYSKMAI